MQIVINIPEEFYNDILNHVGGQQGITAQALVAWKAVERGTPLPKGHGRIGDLDAFIDEYRYCFLNDIADEPFPTLVEADKEVDE